MAELQEVRVYTNHIDYEGHATTPSGRVTQTTGSSKSHLATPVTRAMLLF